MTDNKRTFLLRSVMVTILVSILTVAAFGIGVNVGSRAPVSLSAAPAHTPTNEAETAAPAALGATATPAPEELIDLELVNEAWQLLQEQYYGELPEGREITYDVLRGMVEQLGDPHTAFLDPEHAEFFAADMEGHFEGIGARVDVVETGGILITYLFEGQPAERAGLKVGDIVVAVNDEDVTGLSLLEAVSRIRGPEGSEVKLTVQREAGGLLDIDVVRSRIEIPVVESEMLEDGRIAYVSLSEFSSVAPGRLASTLDRVLAREPEGLILDLRGNPGGLLDAAVRIGSYFVPEGDILIERFKDGSERTYARHGRHILGDVPLVVLVDGGSASASEIVAGAIQDAGTGILIGETTYGKGSVQLPNALSDGSQLRVTIARWFTPRDRAIHEVGLEPDIVVPVTEDDLATGSDPQLERAIEHLLASQTPTPAPRAVK